MKKILPLLILMFFATAVFAQAKKTDGLKKSITFEKILKADTGLNQIGWMGTRSSKMIKSSQWSIGCETLDRDFAQFSKYKKYVGALGAKKGRLQSGWAKTEKQKGVYDFAWMDECVYGLHEMGVEPRISLGYGNPIYGSEIDLGAKVDRLVNNPEAMAAWLKYVETTVKRYKDVCDEWEIWNEPYNQEGVYVRLLIPTAELIKKIQPNAITSAETIYRQDPKGIADRKAMFDALKKEGKTDLIDQWSYHPYVRNPDSVYPLVDALQKELAQYSPKWTLYQGEVGCPSQLEWTHALSFYEWTEYSQVKWDLRRMFGDRMRKIQTSVFTIIDLRYYNMLQSFGLLRANLNDTVVYKRPSYYAVQHVMGYFDDTVEPVEFAKYQASIDRPITIGRFEKNKTPILVIWFGDEIPSDSLQWDKVNLTVNGVSFKDPVYVELISGKILSLDKIWKSSKENAEFKSLPVWDSPMMIVERDQIKIFDKQVK
ncbi:MAG: glycoside hydrolase [Planctomycetia bacterium]|nr:glycoside hydrolase [Planctomycetia bacterium]